jgi:hypothetical protein
MKLKPKVRQYMTQRLGETPTISRILIFIKLLEHNNLGYDEIFDLYLKYTASPSKYENMQ